MVTIFLFKLCDLFSEAAFCVNLVAPHHGTQNGHMVVVTFSIDPWIFASAFRMSDAQIMATCAR